MKVLFEPWSLGDAIIAASALRNNLEDFALACHPRWHEIIREALGHPKNLKLIPIELEYATLKNADEYSWLKKIIKFQKISISDFKQDHFDVVYSIRGDFRDYFSIKSYFPEAQIKMNGWASFFARRISIVNYPYKVGRLPVKNRYLAWIELLGLNKNTELKKINLQKNIKKIGIHIGGQWGSKQYPYYKEVADLLRSYGYEIEFIGGLGDQLPLEMHESDVNRVMGVELIQKIKSFDFILVNDSGPMHLAAFLGIPTFCVVRISNIREWIPPNVDYISAIEMPKGYRADPNYKSDQRLYDWPDAQSVFRRVLPKVLAFTDDNSTVARKEVLSIIQKPKVSILIPVYNREKLIGPCIESALDQTIYDLEVVISDNASTDKTYEICLEYAKKDQRVRVFRNEKNLGPVANWKNSIDQARGEYGKILFSDDCMHPLFLEKTLKLIEKDEMGFVFSAVKIGSEIAHSRLWYPWQNKTGVYEGEEFIRSLYDGKPVPVSPGCALFRLKDLRNNLISGVYTEQKVDFMSHGAGTDVLFYLLSAAKNKKVGFVAEPLTFFRSHEGSITKSTRDGSVKRAYNHALMWFSQTQLNGRYRTKLFSRIWLEEIIIHGGYISPTKSWQNYIAIKILFPIKIQVVLSFFFYLSKRLKQHYF